MRPVITGWYSEFAALPGAPTSGVRYGSGPERFAGATYDPTSHYRAAAVFDFFDEEGLTPELLREVSQHQVSLLASEFDKLGADPTVIMRDRSVRLDQVGGFLALHTPRAADLCVQLKTHGVMADSRAETLRLGPAPYLSDEQLRAAIAALAVAVKRTG